MLKHDGQVLDPLFAPTSSPSFSRISTMRSCWPPGLRRTAPCRARQCRTGALAAHYKPADPRALFRDALVGDELLGEVAQALSLLRWNADNKFCGRCGGTMETLIGGYKRKCTACATRSSRAPIRSPSC